MKGFDNNKKVMTVNNGFAISLQPITYILILNSKGDK